jgi:hypothetical protein
MSHPRNLDFIDQYGIDTPYVPSTSTSTADVSMSDAITEDDRRFKANEGLSTYNIIHDRIDN